MWGSLYLWCACVRLGGVCLCVTPVCVLEGCHSHGPLAPFTPAAQPHDHSRTHIPSPQPSAWSGRDMYTSQDPGAERGCGGGRGGPSSPLRMQSPSTCRLVHGWPTTVPSLTLSSNTKASVSSGTKSKMSLSQRRFLHAGVHSPRQEGCRNAPLAPSHWSPGKTCRTSTAQ